MKKIFAILIAFGGSLVAYSQQELLVSQYMFNGLMLNPAYAGTHAYFSANALHRSQWVQFEKAPVSQVFSIDGPISNDKLGIGLLVHNDKLGVTSQLDASANISYKLLLGSGKLSFGLRAGFSNYSAKLSEVVVWQSGDQVFERNDISGEFVPKFGFGMYYYTDSFYAGLSVPNIYSLDDNILIEESQDEGYFEQHYYLNAGVVIESNTTLTIKPSILVKYVPSAPVEVDLNCNFMFFRKFWLGAGYRTGDALIGMLEYNITPQLSAGYAYDFTLTDIAEYSNGSHEVMVAYDFGKRIEIKTRSPRYF
jgi:type IX secretion system PorP/SprF family membrane protein